MQKQPNSIIIHEERRFEADYPVHLPRRIYYSPDASPSYMHYHNYLELGLCVRGSGVFFIDSEIYPFGEGDISLIFPGEIHIAQ
ncbi:MAG: AraC family ligand binding domain-containing protein, partial [Eubacteriales bacterium]